MNNPLEGVRPLDPTGGAVWILAAALVLGFAMTLLVYGLITRTPTPGRLVTGGACLVAIVGLWPARALVDVEAAPLALAALNALPLALIVGLGLPVFWLMTARR